MIWYSLFKFNQKNWVSLKKINRPHFQETKVNFSFSFSLLTLAKLNLLFNKWMQPRKNFRVYFINIHFFRNQTKKIYNQAKELYYDADIFFDSLLSTGSKKIET